MQDGGEGIGFFGWEVADAAALDALAAQLEAAGVKVARGRRALADERRVKDLIVLADPIGNRVEIFHGAETATDPFKPGRSISGFRTGPLGMGHVVLNVESVDAGAAVLSRPARLPAERLLLQAVHGAYFMHVNPRHHSLAFIAVRQERGASHDDGAVQLRRRRAGLRHRARRGGPRRRHARPPHQRLHDLVLFAGRRRTSWSSTAGAGARSIPTPGRPTSASEGPSLWGHERTWLPPEQREARAHAPRDSPRAAIASRCR